MKRATLLTLISASIAATTALAHDTGFKHIDGPTDPAKPLQLVPEKSGPVRAPAPLGSGVPVSGQGFWKFAAAKELVPTPEETKPFLKGAHGTIIVDNERDIVYWGLERVGWVGFSNKLSRSWVVKGDPKFASGNLHGADLLPRKGQLPLVVAADNNEGEVYLSDTTFSTAAKLGRPPGGPYASDKARFMPTDATFVGARDIFVTDGYGSQWFMHGTTDPLQYDGNYIGGPQFSRTPHGITERPATKTLVIAARPEAQIKEFNHHKATWLDSLQLPPGSTVCDIDIWGDYALAPCLDGAKGPDGKPTFGPIYIVNLKKKTIASVIQVKDDLGYDQAHHIHDAAWYVTGKGRNREVYILFTNWNPGGIGAIKLVNAPDSGK